MSFVVERRCRSQQVSATYSSSARVTAIKHQTYIRILKSHSNSLLDRFARQHRFQRGETRCVVRWIDALLQLSGCWRDVGRSGREFVKSELLLWDEFRVRFAASLDRFSPYNRSLFPPCLWDEEHANQASSAKLQEVISGFSEREKSTERTANRNQNAFGQLPLSVIAPPIIGPVKRNR